MHVQDGFEVQSLFSVFLEKTTAHFLSISTNVRPAFTTEFRLLLDNLPNHLSRIFIKERVATAKKNIDGYAKCP